MNPPTLPKYLLPCIALAALLSLVSIYKRNHVEARNKSVSICAEYDTVESLAASEGISIDQAFKSLKANGLRSVIINEEAAGELIAEGRLAVRYEPQASGEAVAAPIVSGSEADLGRLVRGNRIRYGAFSIPNQVGQDGQQFPNLTPGMLRALPLGLDPAAAKHVRDAGLMIVARMGNPTGISTQGVKDTIAWAAELGAKVFCPVGDQVLGRRDGEKSLRAALLENKMLYASPEFAKIGGDEQMLELLSEDPKSEAVVRLHSAQAAELDKVPPPEAIDRYTRAARERNMRILLLRPIDFAVDKPLTVFSTDFVKEVAKGVIKQGGNLGDPRPFTEPGVPKFVFLLIGLSLIPIASAVGTAFNKKLGLGWAAVAAITGILAYSPHHRQYAALLSAVTQPIAAYLILDAWKGKSVFLAYLQTTAVSLTGGLMVAGLLNSVPYYVRAVEFPGVKLAVFGPIVVVGIYYLWRLTNVRLALKSPIQWGAAALTLIVLGALAVMLLRTGNDNPAAVSSWELKARDILDVVLFVRPRTKAFLIGFPLLYAGISMLLAYKSLGTGFDAQAKARLGGWTALILAGGAIGQTDIVNTLCHIHTPILLSLERIGVAFVVGTLIGLLLWALVKRWVPQPAAEAA